MQMMERWIGEATDVLRRLDEHERREIESALRQLSQEQILIVRDTLTAARLKQRLPLHHVSYLEYLLQEWWKHDLATKLAAVVQILAFSDSPHWPGDGAGDRIIMDVADQLGLASSAV